MPTTIPVGASPHVLGPTRGESTSTGESTQCALNLLPSSPQNQSGWFGEAKAPPSPSSPTYKTHRRGWLNPGWRNPPSPSYLFPGRLQHKTHRICGLVPQTRTPAWQGLVDGFWKVPRGVWRSLQSSHISQSSCVEAGRAQKGCERDPRVGSDETGGGSRVGHKT